MSWDNYRDIELLNAGYKILVKLVAKYMKSKLGDYQNRSVINDIFVIGYKKSVWKKAWRCTRSLLIFSRPIIVN